MKSAPYILEQRPRLFIVLALFWLFAALMLVTRGAQASEIWVFEDPTGKRTYDEVVANPQWFEATTDTSRGFSDSVFWIKGSLVNPLSKPMLQIVQFDSLRLPVVEEFVEVETGTRLRSSGYLIPLASRPSLEHSTSFPVEIEPFGTTEVFYRIESQFKVDLGYQVLDQNAALHADSQTLLIGAFILGSLILLATYNAILALLDRSRVYVFYVGFLVSSSLVTLAYFRLYELFGVVMDAVYLEAYSGVALYAFAYLFLSQLFKTSQTKLTQRLLILGYLVLGGHLLLEPYALIKSYADWAGPIVFFVFTYLVVNAWIKRDPLAKFVMQGWSIYVVCSLLYVANLKGVVGPEFEYVVSLGNLIEGIVLSGVLAYRLRLADQTETLLKAAQFELQRERLANEIGYGYKWEFDLERQMIRPDETFATWHGKGWQAGEWYPAEELFAAVPEEWHSWVAEDMRRCVESAMAEPEYIFQTRHPLKRIDTGEIIWVQVYGKLVELDGRNLLIGSSIDVTELVNSKQAVEAEIEKFESLCSRATLSFWRLDLDTQQMNYNRTFANRWSLEPGGTILFQDFISFVTTSIAQIFRESIEQVIANQAPVERVFQAHAEPLRGQWHRVQFWPVFNERNELIGVDCVSASITELMQTQSRLQDTLNRQKELFAIVGHELRTPVSTIKMLTEYEEITDRERTQQIADISESLLNVLEDMRVVISPERALESKTAPDNPFHIVSRSLNSLKAVIAESGLSLTKQMLQGSYGTYQIHGQALRQIVTNLVKNAAIHSGGTQIAVSMEVLHSRDEESVRIRVEDNGRGIPAESIESLFEAFARGDTSKDGSGLGLYIVKQLAERLSGSIRYTKSPFGGACFTLNFPLGRMLESVSAPVSALVSRPDSELSAINLEGMRILLAEDDNTLRMLTERMLTKKGAVVTACVNGKEALDAFDPEQFDLVVTDLMMPEMDGHELTRAIRATGVTTRIVAVTAAVIGEETEQFMEEGADAVLSKPLRPNALVEALAKIEADALV